MNTLAINQTDGYKVDHRSQYPKGTELVFSNFTPRTNKHARTAAGDDNKVVNFGLQYFIKWYLQEQFQKTFFNKPKEEVVAKYKRRITNYLGPDAITFEHIEALHDLGYLPISIRALPEGVAVNAGVPVLVIENTIPEFFWVTNFLETIMSCMLWKPSTSATTARKYRKLLDRYAIETTGSTAGVEFQGHDFSFRGMSGIQDAQMSGAGHLLSFVGTDTIPAIDFLEDYYGANSDKELIGCSVPATEHSVMCLNVGARVNDDSEMSEAEYDTFKDLITKTYPQGIVSIVSDTWCFWSVVTEFLPRMKDTILARAGGFPVDKLVIRPDSGDPVKIICGDPNAPSGSPEFKGAIECLWETFGGTVTDQGYKLLDSHIGLIYGDSITLERAEKICSLLKKKGFASTNVVLGIGSYTYEYVTRDTHGYAMKATAGCVNGVEKEIFKDPKTDDGMKKSARGYLAVFKDFEGDYYLQDRATREEMENCEFKEVYRDGELLIEQTLSEIRERVAQ